jgi:hypothetical protein
MTKHTAPTRTARKGLVVAALALVAGLGLAPAHASAEEKKPVVVTTPKKDTPQPYLEVKLEDVLVSSW